MTGLGQLFVALAKHTCKLRKVLQSVLKIRGLDGGHESSRSTFSLRRHSARTQANQPAHPKDIR